VRAGDARAGGGGLAGAKACASSHLHNLKSEAGRRKRIAAFVEMLKRGDTIHPQRGKP
jgi:uncharacterized protein YdeI (YjbR/CyaY-like superfamily)